MATFATQDDLNALAQLVRTLQDDITTLDASVGEIDTLIEKINHVEALKDITLTYVTEGDVLQFSSDGTWHNVQPAALNMGIGDGEGSPVDSAIVKSLIQSEGAKLFISKLYDDTAAGQITFENGLVSQNTAYFKEGLEVGDYIPGFLGTGAKIDKNGYAEMSGLTLREFLEVPELRFNKIDVVSGELWNSIAFGTIETVNTTDQIATLKLEDGEYSGLQVGDICRGIFHNIDGYNNTETLPDDCGFDRIQGFSTAYFTPIEIIGERGEKFRYSLKTGTSQHPCPSMKFAVYGSFTNPDRRNSAYHTRTYTRYLKDVATWQINQTLNVASQFGSLDGLVIEGAPNNGRLTGNGAYLSNVYMTNALVQFEPEQEAALKGKDGYSVTLDHYSASVLVDNENNVIDLNKQSRELTFYIQAFKGSTELTYDNVYGEGKYFVEYNPVGCEVTFSNGTFQITNITGTQDCYVSIIVNCEGETLIKQTFTVVPLLEPNSQWTTYHDNDALPPIPTGDGTFDGWHRNYTSTAIWMSSKNTRDVWEGEWGDPVRFVGAPVAGKDGEYTAFAYTTSSVTPPTPKQNSGLPPKYDDESGYNTLYKWSMSPPERTNLSEFTYMTQCRVYADKTQSGWSVPIRITGDDGVDGTDGKDLEFVYGLFTPGKYILNDGKNEVTLDRPWTPVSDQTADDDIPRVNSSGENPPDNVEWSDNPHGVTETNQYEWVCQRTKDAGPHGTMIWSKWSNPVIWSKWGEKGMDGDGYEYIYIRTADIDVIPDPPKATNNTDDEVYPPVYINGTYAGNLQNYQDIVANVKWTDDPKGLVNEKYKAEWVSKRKKTDGIWSSFGPPALWSNWGEQGMQGANYIYRWILSATKPEYNKTLNAQSPNTTVNGVTYNWTADSELQAEGDKFVWQIQSLRNPDGTMSGSWGNLIRLTGENGKDGEDGNSIEFLYARNNTGIAPSPPPTNQQDDWHGSSTDKNNGNVTVKWEDNPQGVTANIMYEYVCQRYKDRNTQQWGAYSTPGIWARYAEKGKDGDGFEYIYRRFGSYQSQNPVSPGGAYYPSTSSYTDGSGKVHQYQEDDFVPPNYTDNPVGPTSDVPYEYVWTRKKKDGTWGNWSNGAMWSRWSKDGEKGDTGATGPTGPAGANGSNGTNGTDGRTYYVKGCPASIRSSLTYLQKTSVTLTALYSDGASTRTQTGYGYWAAYRKTDGGDWLLITRNTSSSSSFSPSWSASADAVAFWFGFSTDSADASYLSPTYAYATWSQEIPVVYDGSDADSSYTLMRDQGCWKEGVEYFNSPATVAMPNEYAYYDNYQNLTVVDYVQYKQNVYMCINKHTSSTSHASTSGLSSSYWKQATKQQVLTVNNLLANNAKLGEFNYSGNYFWSGDGGTSSTGYNNASLYMNALNGTFKCTKAIITGTINATSGTIGGFTLGSTSLTSSGTVPMTMWSSQSSSGLSSAGIKWENSNVLMTLDVANTSPRIKLQDGQLDTSSINAANIMLTGNGGKTSLVIDAQTGVGDSQIKIERRINNTLYYVYAGIDSSGYFYFHSNCFKNDKGSRQSGYLRAGTSDNKYAHLRPSWTATY